MDLSDRGAELQHALLGLTRRLATAEDWRQLAFIAVNETHGLTPYRQAALWLPQGGVVALSGVVNPEDNAPYTQFLRSVFRRVAAGPGAPAPRILRKDDLGEELASAWGEWLPAQGLLVPIVDGRGGVGGSLLLARDEPWQPRELPVLEQLAQQLALALRAHRPASTFSGLFRANKADRRLSWSQRLRRPGIWIAALLLALAFMPLRLSVLAPAELVPSTPEVVRSPLQGVVERVLVEPNQRVALGDPLFEFDSAAISAQLQVAERSLDTLRAEYRQRGQQALADEDSRAALAVVAARMEEQRAEVAYLDELAERGLVLAESSGVVIFDDPSSWNGRPVLTGERVMLIASETDVELEAWLAPDDLIALPEGAEVRLYLNADPLRAVTAQLRYLAYSASERPDGSFAYRSRATLDGEGTLRIGLKGTAKFTGERVSLWYWLLRKPLAALRGLLGW